jgi:hypothetical protein
LTGRDTLIGASAVVRRRTHVKTRFNLAKNPPGLTL